MRREAELAQKISLLHKGLLRWAGREVDGRELAVGLIVPPDGVAHMPQTAKLDPDGLHLYIGGWEHLVETEGGQRLYQRLKETAPDRKLLFRPEA